MTFFGGGGIGETGLVKFFRVGEMGVGEMGQIIGETGEGEMEVGETEVIHTAAPWLDSIKFYMWDPGLRK